MSGHHAHPGLQPRHIAGPVITAAATAIILLALAACTGSTAPGTAASAVAAAAGPGGHAPTLTGACVQRRAGRLRRLRRADDRQRASRRKGRPRHAGARRPGRRRPDLQPVPSGGCPAAPDRPGTRGHLPRAGHPLGYVEQAYSRGLLLPFAAIRNQAGYYVIPSARSVAADAAQKPAITPADFSIVNQPGASSYPISGYSWALVYTRQQNPAIGTALAAMLDWLTHDGQAYAAANGYVPLPPGIQQFARTVLQQITGPAGAHLPG